MWLMRKVKPTHGMYGPWTYAAMRYVPTASNVMTARPPQRSKRPTRKKIVTLRVRGQYESSLRRGLIDTYAMLKMFFRLGWLSGTRLRSAAKGYEPKNKTMSLTVRMEV
jgi:hypothetical protein